MRGGNRVYSLSLNERINKRIIDDNPACRSFRRGVRPRFFALTSNIIEDKREIITILFAREQFCQRAANIVISPYRHACRLIEGQFQ